MKQDNPTPTELIEHSIFKNVDNLSPQQTINPLLLSQSKHTQDTHISTSPTIEEFEVSELLSQLPNLTSMHEIERHAALGKGGMGQVDLAHQHSLKRNVAVKRILPDQVSPKTTHLMLHESFVTGYLAHPNIVPVHILGLDEQGHPQLVMKRVEGISWEELLEQPEHPIWQRRKTWSDDPQMGHIELLMELCHVVDYAHSKGFLHRDIKPENVMIGEFGEVYLLDWGLAVPLSQKAEHPDIPPSFPTQAGGTPAYMAPEMVSGTLERLDERTDIFLLGATLHRIITGKVRHPGQTINEAIFSAVVCSPYDYLPHVPKELARIANQATSANPKDRFQTVRALRDALSNYLKHLPSSSLAQTATEKHKQLQQQTLGCLQHTPQQSVAARRLFNECRFAYLQALESWPANELAQKGLTDAIGTMLSYEIHQQNLDNASALFDELKQPSRQQIESLNKLQQDLLKRQAEHTQMKKMAFERDFSIGLHSRMRFFVGIGIAIIALAIGIFSSMQFQLITLNHHILLYSVFFSIIGLSGGLWFKRDLLLKNTVSRQFFLTVLLCMVLMFLGRLGSKILSLPPHFGLMYEFLLFAMLIASISHLSSPSLLWGILVSCSCFLLAIAAPEYTDELFLFMTCFLWCFPVYIISRNPPKSTADFPHQE